MHKNLKNLPKMPGWTYTGEVRKCREGERVVTIDGNKATYHPALISGEKMPLECVPCGLIMRVDDSVSDLSAGWLNDNKHSVILDNED